MKIVPVWPSDQLIWKFWSESVPPGPTYFAVAVDKTWFDFERAKLLHPLTISHSLLAQVASPAPWRKISACLFELKKRTRTLTSNLGAVLLHCWLKSRLISEFLSNKSDLVFWSLFLGEVSRQIRPPGSSLFWFTRFSMRSISLNHKLIPLLPILRNSIMPKKVRPNFPSVHVSDKWPQVPITLDASAVPTQALLWNNQAKFKT